MIQVEIDGLGKVAEFPDGTDQTVIDSTIKRDFFPSGKNLEAYDVNAQFKKLLGTPEAKAEPVKKDKSIDTSADPIYQKGVKAMGMGKEQFNLFKKSYPDIAEKIENKNLPIDPKQVADLVYPFVKPLRAAGYSLFKGLNEGLKSFTSGMDTLAEYASLHTGMSKGDIFKKAAKMYEENEEYWKKKAEEEGVGAVTEFLMETVGGAAPGIAEFMLSAPWYAAKGAAKAKSKEENELIGALKGAMERGLMGKLMHTAAQLSTPLRMGTYGGLFEQQAEAEGEKDPKKLGKAFATGAIFGAGGKGTVRARDIVQEIYNLEKEGISKGPKQLQNERGEVPIVVERRGKEGESYAPKGESTIEYEGDIAQYELSPKANIYKGISSYDFIKNNVDLDKSDPLLKPYGIKNWKELLDDAGVGDIGNKKYQDELASGTQSRFFQLMQDKAKEVLKGKGYSGAEWSSEDVLNPHQFQVWDRSAIKKVKKEQKMAPALKVDGKVYKAGTTHGDIYGQVPTAELEKAQNLETGWVDKDGKWLSDKEAREARKKEGEMTLGFGLGGGQGLFPRFRSNTADEVNKETAVAMPAQEWYKRVMAWGGKYSGVKEENKWSGLPEWLESRKGDKKVTKEEVMSFLEASKNGWLEPVQTAGIPEGMKNQEKVIARPDPWLGYNIPGGIPGTEKVFAFKLPGKVDIFDAEREQIEKDRAEGKISIAQYREKMDELGRLIGESEGTKFQSSHFPDVPNVVFHIRTHKMKDKDDNIGLVAETIQSDWHQQRKTALNYSYKYDEEGHEYIAYRGTTPVRGFETEKEAKEWVDNIYGKKVPSAPFESTWHEAALKQVMDMAAIDPEVKWVGWPSGKVQMERWGKVSEEFNLDNPRHENIFNKIYDELYDDFISENGREPRSREEEDLSDRAMDIAEELAAGTGEGKPPGTDFLEVLYDSKLPKFAKPYAKKLGGEYKKYTISPSEEDMEMAVEQDRTSGASQNWYGEYSIHRVDLPTSAKEKVRTEGQQYYTHPLSVLAAAGVAAASTEDDTKRKDGSSKGPGWLGTLKMKDGSGEDATEISVGVNIDGKDMEIPALVPDLTEQEIDYLLKGGKVTPAILRKAVFHAKKRLKRGLSPFKEGKYTKDEFI